MRYRQLSPTGDYMFGQGQANFLVNSPACVAQIIQTYLKLWYGEWYLANQDGTPWLEGVFGYHENNQETADQTLINVVLGLPGVSDLNNWVSTVDPKTRTYTSISADVDTIFGPTTIALQNMGSL